MLVANIPLRMGIYWGQSAGGAYIHQVPDASQIGVIDGAASFLTGYPPLCFSPQSAGGTPPLGTDFNGIFRQITQWNQWQQAGAPIGYNTAFSTSVGGYPKGAVLASASSFGDSFVSLVDSNTNDPDVDPTGWQKSSFFGSASTGDAKLSYKPAADAGWIFIDDGAIGNATSGATTRANADCAALFEVWWNGISNTYCQTQTSAGVPVARGASAAVDFAASRRLTTPKVLGRMLMISGAGAFGLTPRALGEFAGAETMAILQANLPNVNFIHSGTTLNDPQHFHTGSIPALAGGAPSWANSGSGLGVGSSNTSSNLTGISVSAQGSAASGGSGTPLSIMNPFSALKLMVKL